MITVRNPETIYQASGQIKKGTFHGRWHFSFDQYYDPEYTNFGTLRVFNDDTLSPGAVWPRSDLMEQYGVNAIGQFTQMNSERLSKLSELVERRIIKVYVEKTFLWNRQEKRSRTCKRGIRGERLS